MRNLRTMNEGGILVNVSESSGAGSPWLSCVKGH